MSAIWGCVDFESIEKQSDISTAMQSIYKDYKIDRYEAVEEESVIMGCGIQYIKRWSHKEQLPIVNNEMQVIFTTDCVIDNRKELIQKLQVDDMEIADGALLFLAYQKWGPQMGAHVFGSYSYAAYHTDTKKLILGVDYIASRTLYYQRVGSKLYFGTRIDSILAGSKKKELNEEWLGIYLALEQLSILSNPEDTVYTAVFRLEAAHYYVIDNNSVEKVLYRDVRKVEPLKLGSDEEYCAKFRELFQQCVEESIDGVCGEPGSMLSGGFDSTTTTAWAAKALEKENKSIHGYTYVPIDEYQTKMDIKYSIPDETEKVLEFASLYPNIQTNFIKNPEENGFSNMREILETYESPYKSITNVGWIHGLFKKMGTDGRKLVLIGQMGNMTISFGRTTEMYIQELVRQKRLLKALKTANRLAKMKRYSRKKYFRYLFKEMFGKIEKDDNYLEKGLLGAKKAEELEINYNDKRIELNGPKDKYKRFSFQEYRQLVANSISYAHVAEYDCGMSLKQGFLVRDPSKDARMLMFCNSLPIECFTNENLETRRLVRVYCKDLLPQSFLPETAPRGVQSSDWKERITPTWDAVYADIQKVLSHERVREFLDEAQLTEVLKKYKEIPEDDLYGYEFRKIGILYLLGVFLEKNNYF